VTPRPLVFISAVSREFRSARQLVANTLAFLGYEPVWQNIFGTEGGDLRAVLRAKIDECKGLVQLVGQMYGCEPPTSDEEFGRISYTQYEALYARKCGKKVWYLFIDKSFPIDVHDPESPELTELQAAYRHRLQCDTHVFHPLSSVEGLEISVLRLRDDLERLRRGVKKWAACVMILLSLIVGLGFWILHREAEIKKMLLQGNNKYAEEEAIIRREHPEQAPVEIAERTYAALAKKLGVDQTLLEEKLPQFAQQLKQNPEATTFDRANAAYVSKDYHEAERLALVAAEEAEKAVPPKTSDAMKAYKLAALSAGWRGAYWIPGGHFEIGIDQTHNSPWSFKLSTSEPNHLRWVRPLQLEPNAEYLLTVWIRTEDVAHSKERYDRGANAAIQFMSPPQEPIHSEPVLGTSDWRQVSVQFATSYMVEIEEQLQLGGYSATTTGTAWFDDVQLKRLR
jgi:hypothetical protein